MVVPPAYVYVEMCVPRLEWSWYNVYVEGQYSYLGGRMSPLFHPKREKTRSSGDGASYENILGLTKLAENLVFVKTMAHSLILGIELSLVHVFNDLGGIVYGGIRTRSSPNMEVVDSNHHAAI